MKNQTTTTKATTTELPVKLVTTMAKKEATKKASTTRVNFAFCDGHFSWTFPNSRTISIELDKIPDTIKNHAMLHGIKQKVGDAAAISRNTDTGVSATYDDKANAMQMVVDRLLAGGWNLEAGEREPTGGLLAQALALVTGKTIEDVRAKLALLDKTQKTALEGQKKVADAMAKLRAQKSEESGIDGNALLDAF